MQCRDHLCIIYDEADTKLARLGERGGGGGGKEGEREIKGKEWKRQSEVIELHKPKIKLKYPEEIWICLLSFCGRQSEKTVLQI